MYRPKRELTQNRSKIHGTCILLSWPKDSYGDINRPPIMCVVYVCVYITHIMMRVDL